MKFHESELLNFVKSLNNDKCNKFKKFNNVKVLDLSTKCQGSGISESQNAHEEREVCPESQIAPFSWEYPPAWLGSTEDWDCNHSWEARSFSSSQFCSRSARWRPGDLPPWRTRPASPSLPPSCQVEWQDTCPLWSRSESSALTLGMFCQCNSHHIWWVLHWKHKSIQNPPREDCDLTWFVRLKEIIWMKNCNLSEFIT